MFEGIQQKVAVMRPGALDQAEEELHAAAAVVRGLSEQERLKLRTGLENLRAALSFAGAMYRNRMEMVRNDSLYSADGSRLEIAGSALEVKV